MKVIKKIAISILILSHNLLTGQDLSMMLSLSEDSAVQKISIDKLNNIWRIYPNKIIRYSEQKGYSDTFILQTSISNLRLDLKFPLKNLIYNSQSNTIEIKNSRWGSNSTIDLDKLQIYDPSFVNFSSDESILILDRNSNNLFKINESGILKTKKINPFQENSNYFFPTEIIDLKGSIIAMDSSMGIFVLDPYLNCIQREKIDNIRHIYDYKNQILIYKSDSILVYNVRKEDKTILQSNLYFTSPKKISNIQVFKDELILYFEDRSNQIFKNTEELFQKLR